MAERDLTPAMAAELFEYDPETGIVKWRLWRVGVKRCLTAGSIDGQGYVSIEYRHKQYKAHRVAHVLMTGVWPDKEVDHVNGLRADNRWCNLRLASHSQNQHNRGLAKNNKSGYHGVHWSKAHGKWRANICVDSKNRHLGFFERAEDAATVYLFAKAHLHPFNPVQRGEAGTYSATP